MRREIDNLTERLNSATDESLRKENETLKMHIKADASLINALQRGVDSSTKLYQMMESCFQRQVEGYAKNLAEAEKAKSELSGKNVTLKNELDELKHFVSSSQKRSDHQIQDLTKHLVEVESANVEAIEKNAKLDHELRDLKQYVASVETPLQQKIQNLSNNLSEAKILTTETSKKNTILEKELTELRHHAANVEAALQKKIQDLSNNLSEDERVAVEMSEKNVKLEHELGEVKQYAENIRSLYENQNLDLNKNQMENVEMSEKITKLEAEINGLKNFVASKDKELIEAMKAEKKLDTLKDYATSMVTDLQNQIQIFEKNLAHTQKKNLELELELKKWKIDSAPVSIIFVKW